MQQATAALGRPLIGRQCELAALWAQVEGAVAGRTRVALVAGDPGIGKTCLLNTLAARAAAAGATVLHGSASQAEGMPPYLPVLTALGAYIRAAPLEQLRAQVDARAVILAMVLPEVVERLGPPPPGYPLPPEQARLRLYDAVGAFLAALSTERRWCWSWTTYSGPMRPAWICCATWRGSSPTSTCVSWAPIATMSGRRTRR